MSVMSAVAARGRTRGAVVNAAEDEHKTEPVVKYGAHVLMNDLPKKQLFFCSN